MIKITGMLGAELSKGCQTIRFELRHAVSDIFIAYIWMESFADGSYTTSLQDISETGKFFNPFGLTACVMSAVWQFVADSSMSPLQVFNKRPHIITRFH